MIPQLYILIVGLVVMTPVGVLAQGAYRAARHGGNYMHNYYFPPSPSSTPWAPTWAPDGDLIAVAISGSIWLVDPENGTAREVTSDENYHSLPSWSPDGRWIVYTSDNGGGNIQLEIVNLETGVSQPLTSDDGILYGDPAFSPDGRQLAYVSTAPNGYFNVYVRPITEGAWAGPPIAVTSDNDFGSDRLYFGRWDMHMSPAWIPGANEILIVSNRNEPLGSGFVWRTPLEQGGITKATSVLQEQTLYRTRPDVSPDGKRFVYSSTSGTADQFNNLYVQPTAGGTPYKWTFYDYDAFHPRWSPDGEQLAFITNQRGLSQLVIQDVNGGYTQTVDIAQKTYNRPMGILRAQISADHNRDTVRVTLTASDGKFYAPTNAYARVGVAGDQLFHATGEFEVTLPVGPVTITAVKGFEFTPRTFEAHIEADQVTTLDLNLSRAFDMASLGWYNGSTHVHMNYAGNLRNTLENMMMMSAAEDQDMVTVQIANKDNRVLDYQFFEPGGGTHSQTHHNRLLVVGQEYRPPFYGHVFMLGLRDHLISPFTTGYVGTAIESLYPSNTDMLRQAKAQGATVGYVHPFTGESDPLNGNLGGGKGFMVDAVLGTTDALEWSVSNRAGFFPLYAAWNNGLEVTAVGGEDSISDLHRSKLVGSIRTYVCIDGSFTSRRWFQRLEDGHAFVSSGPMVDLRVDGRGPGETVNIASGETVTVTARVKSIVPVERVAIYFNGRQVTEVPLTESRSDINVEANFNVTGSGWFHLRTAGAPEDRFPLDVSYAQAFTNPVWVSVNNQPIRNASSANYGVRWVDKLQSLALADPGWRSQNEIDHVMAQFAEARAAYQTLAREAPARTADAEQLGSVREIDSNWGACWN